MRKNKVGRKLKYPYNRPMKKLFLIATLLLLSFSSLAAKKKDYWLKVESDSPQKKTKNNKPYPYDSLEADNPNKSFSETGFWSLQPKLLFTGGFHGDKAFIREGKTNRWFLGSGLQFRNHPWHRITIIGQLQQNNTLFVSGAWEYTPSRKAFRHYYGAGLAHLLVSDKQLSNLVELEHYFVTLSAGFEYLLQSRHGVMLEAKGFLGTNNYAVQITLGYLIPL